MKLVPSLIACAALAACVSYDMRQGDGMPRAKIGQAVKVGNFELTPLQVLEDSRCPTGVQCVWAGQLRLRARIDFAASVETRELTLGEAQPVGNGMLTLAEATPHPEADQPIYPEDYRFGFSYAPNLAN